MLQVCGIRTSLYLRPCEYIASTGYEEKRPVLRIKVSLCECFLLSTGTDFPRSPDLSIARSGISLTMVDA